jgi:hypothetical protein
LLKITITVGLVAQLPPRPPEQVWPVSSVDVHVVQLKSQPDATHTLLSLKRSILTNQSEADGGRDCSKWAPSLALRD